MTERAPAATTAGSEVVTGKGASRVLVVSLPKCGTNLIGTLFTTIGYHVTGEGIDNAFPYWCRQFDAEFVNSFPANTCYVLHRLSLSGLDPLLASFWRTRGLPKILFNYRDPRAALVSMINYVLGSRYSGAAWQQIAADIFAALPEPERIAYGIDYFEDFLFRSYRESAWLLKHPRVLCCSFERLIGPTGGGSADEQLADVERILRFAGSDREAAEIAMAIFDPRSRTFATAQRDAWRRCFTPADLDRFARRHGDILDAFGYRA